MHPLPFVAFLWYNADAMVAHKDAETKRWKHLLEQLQTEDLLEATRRARRKSMARLEDQGIAALALFLSEVLARTLELSTSSEPPSTPP